MKRLKLRITTEAYNDLKDARTWYRDKNPSLPKKFNTQVKITLENLRTLPATHSIRYRSTQIANIAVFPYAIHYLIEDETIIVLAVHHTSINPNKWEGRLSNP